MPFLPDDIKRQVAVGRAHSLLERVALSAVALAEEGVVATRMLPSCCQPDHSSRWRGRARRPDWVCWAPIFTARSQYERQHPNPEQWRRQLSAEQYHVCWEKGTERPYSGALLHNRKSGDYLCVCCKQVLFHSDAKFDSGCGWPSFDRAIEGP